MIRALSLATAPVVWLICAAPLLAQANPLEVIPDDVLGFAVIDDLTDTNERITKLTQKMQLPVPDVLGMAKGYLGVDKGLDEKGGLAVALVAGPEDRPLAGSAPMIIVPVTDYAEFLKPLAPKDAEAAVTEVTVFGTPMLVGKKGSFAVFTVESGFKDELETFLAAKGNVQSAVAPLKDWMAQQQLAVVVTPKGKTLILNAIAESLPTAEQLEKQAKETEDDDEKQAPDAEALGNLGQMMGVFKQLLSAADQEVTHLAAGIRIEDSAALHVTAKALWVPGGTASGWSKEVKAPEGGVLKGVPPGKFVLAYGGVSAHFGPEAWAIIGQLGDSGMQMMGLKGEARDKYMVLAAELQKGKRSTGGVMSMVRPGDSIFSTAVSVEHVDDANAQLKTTREMYALLEANLKIPDSDEAMYEVEEVKVGDLDAIALITRIDSIAALQGDAAEGADFQNMFRKLFGGGNLTAYSAKATDTVIVSAYSKEQLVRGVEHVRSKAAGLESDEGIAATTALLPAGSQWAAYLSPQGVVQMIESFMDAMLGGQFKLPPFPESDPIGLAARVSETGVDAEIVLPENVVAGIGQFVFAVGQMFQGGGAPLP
jgi:hypothetical protein